MPEYSSHPPGTFCWPELATTDQQGGVAFYRALFGWDVNEQPIGPAETYSMFQMRGKEVAAAYTMRPEERSHGVPPHWNSYVAVANADAAVTRAQELGATVLAPPFDVMDAGRMAVLQDPTGAVFQVWQATKHIGARIQNEPNALCWTELTTRDPDAARKFYTSLFGWTDKTSTAAGMAYTEVGVGDRMVGGIMKTPEEMGDAPPNWMPYFAVGDADAAAANAKALGGQVHVKPRDIPNVGRFAVLGDPQGAVFSIIKVDRPS